ncbi:hypothetical protein GF382_03020 [Candidatus Falkowbacteria bacterium]|nr:hypothetical protein [Candidatus Falkowbacteria bacterium]
MKIGLIFLFLISSSFLGCCEAEGSEEISVEPALIDEEADPRDLLEYDIKIKNNAEERRDLYVIVSDISESGEVSYDDPSELDQASSITRWTQITRGVIELSGGEERVIPLKINIPNQAIPGTYHAVITFARGSNRLMAEDAAKTKNESKVMINIKIKKNEVELAEVSEFGTKGGVITKVPVEFKTVINNIGNKDIIPEGEIVIYNKSGKLIDSIKVSETRKTVPAGKKTEFKTYWESQKSIGRFKAKLMMYYGQDKKDLQDVDTFVLMPLLFLVILIIFVIMSVSLLTYLLLKRSMAADESAPVEMESRPIENERTPRVLEITSDRQRSVKNIPQKDNKNKNKTPGDKYVINLRSK